MNGLQVRKTNPPLTPNLEDYKQKNKSKSRRKPITIQPTNPPTPKMHRPHIHLKSNIQTKQNPVFCSLHPDQYATHTIDNNPRQKFCLKCAIIHNEDACLPHQIQQEKKRQIDQFRTQIKNVGLQVEDVESYIRQWNLSTEEKFFKWKGHIEQTFDSLAEQLEQKKRQLLGSLFENQQKINATLSSRRTSLQQMQCAIQRYLEDIENNYQDIIEDLSYQQFEQIMDKYNTKIKYYSRNILHLQQPPSINVFIPKKDIQKSIAKTTLTLLPQFDSQQQNYTRTLQRYPTEKYSLAIDCSQRNLQSVGGKISQQRKSRDRDLFCQLRKENMHNYGNYYR